ncbi:MAG: sigma-70 family RNA polymerase sigma factor, partial [Alphaproteobacteria bacterium]|nr:sigma-70 family RNA polymerase sigma factor [Alphaproteobacteria bacterium]
MTQSEEWTALAAQAQKGDKECYHKLLKALAPYIRNIALRRISNTEYAEDITQEVLISVHKSLHTYGADRAFKPWLNSIINFRLIDYMRKHYADRQDQTATTENNPEFIAQNVTHNDHIGELKDIETVLTSLPENQQRIFRMIKIEGYSAKEVANEMNMKESAVKVSAHRTLKKIQGVLND